MAMNMTGNSFFVRGTNLWNSLPNRITRVGSVGGFAVACWYYLVRTGSLGRKAWVVAGTQYHWNAFVRTHSVKLGMNV